MYILASSQVVMIYLAFKILQEMGACEHKQDGLKALFFLEEARDDYLFSFVYQNIHMYWFSFHALTAVSLVQLDA